MRGRVLRRATIAGGIALVLAAEIFYVSDARSAEPTKGDAHKDHQMRHHDSPMSPKPGQATPKGWRFALPPGDAEAGRKAFTELECFKCHAVQGEEFPGPKADQGGVGPDLSGVGSMHPAEFFAELLINPNASAAWRIKHHKEEQKGYLGLDGKTKMPIYNGTMTVQQLIDLVAYLKSLTGPVEHKH